MPTTPGTTWQKLKRRWKRTSTAFDSVLPALCTSHNHSLNHGPSGPFLFGPAEVSVSHSVLPHQASGHTPLAFPVPPGVHIPLEGSEKGFLWEYFEHHAHMTNATQSLIVNRKQICYAYGRQRDSLVPPGPGRGSSIYPLEYYSTLLK